MPDKHDDLIILRIAGRSSDYKLLKGF